MANKYLGRDGAPFGADTWRALDEAMIGAAKGQLAGRRILHLQGPYGLGLKAVPLSDEEGEDGLIGARYLPLHYIHSVFSLSGRDLAAYERQSLPIDTREVAEAAIKVAHAEDRLIFRGAVGAEGLLTARGAQRVSLGAWDEVGKAVDSIIGAVTTLDQAGFHGPYALALAPARYNALFRLYPRGNRTEMEHLSMLVTDGIAKVPVLEDGGVLIASGEQYASIVLGQDMSIGFIGPADQRIEMSISESLALRILNPGAICVLE